MCADRLMAKLGDKKTSYDMNIMLASLVAREESLKTCDADKWSSSQKKKQ